MSPFPVALLLLTTIGPQIGTDRPIPVTLASMTDRYRPLLVFSPSDQDPRLLTQARVFAHNSHDLHERQVLFVPLSLHHTSAKSSGMMLDAANQGAMTPPAMLSAREHFHIAPTDFVVLLIGKDGGEKQRWHQPVPYDTLSALIDAMPMRQGEMHTR